ncbi:MAG TPA: lipocalin-like domain-containing protein [Candidatus Dormibacteraeota bacterium]|nr:lipocalin-like domain-containing protein [Candidatus Dormibacteraeota bacterium]
MRRLFALLAIVACCAAGWRSAGAPYRFVFPRDDGSHPAYRTEWWYLTGHLVADDGHRYGFELTIFRLGLEPGAPTPAPGESRWRNGEIFPAHFALTDVTDRRFTFTEQVVRPALGQAGSSRDRLDVHALDWSIRGEDPIRLRARTAGDAIDLSLRSLKPPAINGTDGISWKGSCRTCASHYYSLTRLVGTGTVRVSANVRHVRALAWMDHEFGSDELEPGVVGWDWFALQLADGREIMLYRLRRADGSAVPQSSGTLVERDGRTRHLTLAEFSTEATGTWVSPHTHARYPSGWIVRVPSAHVAIRVTPRLRDQELVSPGHYTYWEGDVCLAPLNGPPDRCTAGEGYVELTGYAEPLQL